MEKSKMMNQSDFERLSQLMADKGVRHEAFELLADLRQSEGRLFTMYTDVSMQLHMVKSSLEGLCDFEGFTCSDGNFIQVLRKAVQDKKSYDRIMSGKKTLKEMANFLGKPVAVDKSGAVYVHQSIPHMSFGDMWVSNLFDCMAIHPNFIDFNGNWKDSLTLPDGWQEK